MCHVGEESRLSTESEEEEGRFGGTHVPHRDHSKIFPASTLLGVHSASFGGDEKTGFCRRGKTGDEDRLPKLSLN